MNEPTTFRRLRTAVALIALGAVVACASGPSTSSTPGVDAAALEGAAAHRSAVIAPTHAPSGAVHIVQHEPHACALCRVYDEVREATFIVRTGSGIGTAVLLTEDGLAVTNAHVVGEAETVRLFRHDGTAYRADVAVRDEAQDLALLRVRGLAKGIAPLSVVFEPPPVGTDVLAVGHPLGLGWTITRGIVSGLPRLDGRPMIQTDAPISPGNSGGPLVDVHGHLVGIVTEKISAGAAENLAFARPSAVVMAFLDAAGARLTTVARAEAR